MAMDSGHKKRIGAIGELVVAKHLARKGYLIVDRNYLRKWGEIDIVARRGERLHFIEVKTVSREMSQNSRNGVTHGTSYRAEDNVHRQKLQRLHRAIETWIIDNEWDGEWQIDVAAVALDATTKRGIVKMIENVILED